MKTVSSTRHLMNIDEVSIPKLNLRRLIVCLMPLGVWYLLRSRFNNELAVAVTGILGGIGLIEYGLMRLSLVSRLSRFLSVIFPLAVLVVIKHPSPFAKTLGMESLLTGLGIWVPQQIFIGFSYSAFRMISLAQSVRIGVPIPNFLEYFGFIYFLPTLQVGPISSYETFQGSFNSAISKGALFNGVQRIIIGAAKFYVLSNFFDYIGYATLTEHSSSLRIWIAVFGFYLSLYCNFSGAVDMAIGVAGLIGFQVDENFDRPFLARNVKDFWNRWHITLSVFMRNMVFSPVTKVLARVLPPEHSIAISSCIVFIAIGLWHGFSKNFVMFGVAHAVGMVVVHYYTLGLKRYLGGARYRRYLEHRGIKYAMTCVTQVYVAWALVFFANKFDVALSIMNRAF